MNTNLRTAGEIQLANPYTPKPEDIRQHAKAHSLSPGDAANELDARADTLVRKMNAIAGGQFSKKTKRLEAARAAAEQAEMESDELADIVMRLQSALVHLATKRKRLARFSEACAESPDTIGKAAVENLLAALDTDSPEHWTAYTSQRKHLAEMQALKPFFQPKLEELEAEIRRAEVRILADAQEFDIDLQALVDFTKKEAGPQGRMQNAVDDRVHQLAAEGFIFVPEA